MQEIYIEMSKKLKIIFLVILIPLGFLLKIFYGIHLNDKAVNIYWGEHIGFSEAEAASLAVSQFDKAKKYYKWNYLIYYNQARLYGQIQQY